jgi:hypothetical protein
MSDDDVFLLKYKSLGMPDKQIASKLSISIGEVQRRWEILMERTRNEQANGYNYLRDYWTNLCHQYMLLGESLKGMGLVLNDIMPEDQIRSLIADDKEETVKNLLSKAIVLSPCSITKMAEEIAKYPPPSEPVKN